MHMEPQHGNIYLVLLSFVSSQYACVSGGGMWGEKIGCGGFSFVEVREGEQHNTIVRTRPHTTVPSVPTDGPTYNATCIAFPKLETRKE